jgi:ABC-2 type transport system ATP-binding protein
MNTTNILECHNLYKSFGNTVALEDINLEISRGKIIGLLGPNGSGKTTLIKVLNNLINPNGGIAYIDGEEPGLYTKSIVSYLPDRDYLAKWMKVKDALNLFSDFYDDFDRGKALNMCLELGIDENMPLKEMSKGTKEKVQLILVMSRKAQLYLLDEPIGGVDPAARDYILETILNNFNEDGTVIISTHLIADIEKVLDEVVFIKDGHIVTHANVDEMRENEGKSIEAVFKDIFRLVPNKGVLEV